MTPGLERGTFPAKLGDLPTPALIVDAEALEDNIAMMAAALPGPRLRPHVKAHKCTGLARRQAAAGHPGFTCATIRECEGMAAAGLGQDPAAQPGPQEMQFCLAELAFHSQEEAVVEAGRVI